MSDIVYSMTVVGPRIKRLREGMQLSLRDLSARSGVSAPMLSQVERGETSPTLMTAERIASGLELTLSQLLRLDEAPAAASCAPRERPVAGSGPHRVSLLTPDLPGQRVAVAEHELAPARRSPVPTPATSRAAARSASCSRAPCASRSTARRTSSRTATP